VARRARVPSGRRGRPLVPAEDVEHQLVAFIAGFAPDHDVREEILRRLANTTAETAQTAQQRGDLEERLRRTRDLYELGDLKRAEYVARRDAITTQLTALAPGPTHDLRHARKALEDFEIFWTKETNPDAKRQFLQLIFDGIWLDERKVVAVQPKPSFLAFFEQQAQKVPANVMCKERERRDSNPRPLP
jgi:hypothetical protein